ncbi:hypothetical protein BE20_39905 [Sorangium cellulosum]|uniref:Uncharacterized protein n=1 Tax=Sorangium cellulosum TaxID=56 RepID=A0A150RAV9_SORCE|nr:hypothetical protein BE18_52165 [Sorangium cellulosum]KYF97096.1 hypothetical protein BE20_39905 [Sorangium cellulosum]
MPTRDEHKAAFRQLLDLLHTSLDTCAAAIRSLPGAPEQAALEAHFEVLLDRHADLYGIGTYENNVTSAIFSSAVHNEAWMALEHEAEASRPRVTSEEERQELLARAASHRRRARALIDACRRGVRLRVPQGIPHVDPYRGVYITPDTPEVRRLLTYDREPFIRFRDGVVATVHDSRIADFQALDAAVAVLYLDGDALHDAAVDAAQSAAAQAALERDFAARLEYSEREGKGVGEPIAAQTRRALLHQSHVLRNLGRRAASEHPAAHQAMTPVLREHTAMLLDAIAAFPVAPAVRGGPDALLSAVVDQERRMTAHAAAWAASARAEDAAGLRAHFEAAERPSDALAPLVRNTAP